MNLEKMLSLMKDYNSSLKAVSKNEGVILKVNDSLNTVNQSASTTEPVKKTPMRCCIESCKKKLSLSTNFTCKCDNTKLYCSAHRMPEDHPCTAPKGKVDLVEVRGEKLKDRI
jgi:hypothetical protein